MALERISVTIDEELVEQFESYLEGRGYRNRSEAVRDLIRDRLESEQLDRDPDGHCVGTLTYVFNHHERELARRLTHAQHHHHDVSVSTLHIHLDHDNCMETVVVNGPVVEVQAFANSIISQPGVRHGKLNLIPAQVEQQQHAHGSGTRQHSHTKPQN